MKRAQRWRRTCQECGAQQFPLAPENGAEFTDRWENAKCHKCGSEGSLDRGAPYRLDETPDDDEGR